MKSLAERHTDRAQRKADNMAESTANNVGNGVSAALAILGDARDRIAGLSATERDELKKAMGEMSDPFTADEGYRSIAEDDTGALAMAGVGVVNAAVTPGVKVAEIHQTEAQSGELPASNIDPSKGNVNGAAVAAATEGWGSPAEGGGNDLDAASTPKTGKGAKAADTGSGTAA